LLFAAAAAVTTTAGITVVDLNCVCGHKTAKQKEKKKNILLMP